MNARQKRLLKNKLVIGQFNTDETQLYSEKKRDGFPNTFITNIDELEPYIKSVNKHKQNSTHRRIQTMLQATGESISSINSVKRGLDIFIGFPNKDSFKRFDSPNQSKELMSLLLDETHSYDHKKDLYPCLKLKNIYNSLKEKTKELNFDSTEASKICNIKSVEKFLEKNNPKIRRNSSGVSYNKLEYTETIQDSFEQNNETKIFFPSTDSPSNSNFGETIKTNQSPNDLNELKRIENFKDHLKYLEKEYYYRGKYNLNFHEERRVHKVKRPIIIKSGTKSISFINDKFHENQKCFAEQAELLNKLLVLKTSHEKLKKQHFSLDVFLNDVCDNINTLIRMRENRTNAADIIKKTMGFNEKVGQLFLTEDMKQSKERILKEDIKLILTNKLAVFVPLTMGKFIDRSLMDKNDEDFTRVKSIIQKSEKGSDSIYKRSQTNYGYKIIDWELMDRLFYFRHNVDTYIKLKDDEVIKNDQKRLRTSYVSLIEKKSRFQKKFKDLENDSSITGERERNYFNMIKEIEDKKNKIQPNIISKIESVESVLGDFPYLIPSTRIKSRHIEKTSLSFFGSN